MGRYEECLRLFVVCNKAIVADPRSDEIFRNAVIA